MQQPSKNLYRIFFLHLTCLMVALLCSASAQAEEYSANGKRDPFMDLSHLRDTQVVKEVGPPPLDQRPPGLPGLLVSEVIVSGTAGNEQQNLVILKGIDNASYIAAAGSRLFDGYLSEITNDRVIFIREVTDTRGRKKTSKVVKRLNTEDR